MLTEGETKEKWCPEARGFVYEGAVNSPYANRSGHSRVEASCIASRCMMWRWDPNQTPATAGTTWAEWNAGNMTNRRGYCGKAGLPHG